MLPAIRPAVLLVDDDPNLLSVLSRRLSREGLEVRTAPSGVAALASLERGWPAMLIVDLMMPGMDGFELCRRVKRIADLPILVLSAIDASESKVRALEQYAEDYVIKPFDPDELVARVGRILRRSGAGRSMLALDNGELEIDLASRRIATSAGTQPLTPTEARLLQVLIASIDRTVPTETLLERVWSDADGADPSYVWVTVRRLRRKLELDPDRPRYLLTDRGVGYRLASTAALPTPAAPTPAS
jgi:DNA-binding response OmpR family regulator